MGPSPGPGPGPSNFSMPPRPPLAPNATGRADQDQNLAEEDRRLAQQERALAREERDMVQGRARELEGRERTLTSREQESRSRDASLRDREDREDRRRDEREQALEESRSRTQPRPDDQDRNARQRDGEMSGGPARQSLTSVGKADPRERPAGARPQEAEEEQMDRPLDRPRHRREEEEQRPSASYSQPPPPARGGDREEDEEPRRPREEEELTERPARQRSRPRQAGTRPQEPEENHTSGNGHRHDGADGRGNGSRVFEEYWELLDEATAQSTTAEAAGASPLDVNVIASLVYWVSLAKQRLGDQKLQELLELYLQSGHSRPGLPELLAHLQSIVAPAPPGAGQGNLEWVDLMFQLHGILTGGLPVGRMPAVALPAKPVAAIPQQLVATPEPSPGSKGRAAVPRVVAVE